MEISQERRFKVAEVVFLLLVCIIVVLAIKSASNEFEESERNYDRAFRKQPAVRFTGKTKRNVTYDKDQILYFNQFEDFGIGNFVEQCENGTFSTIKIDGVYFYTSQYFLTFVAEIDTKETQRSSNIYAYHQYGKDGKVEFFKLPNLQGDGWLQQISHSWMWTIAPERHRDKLWFQVDSHTNFLNYTLTVFNFAK